MNITVTILSERTLRHFMYTRYIKLSPNQALKIATMIKVISTGVIVFHTARLVVLGRFQNDELAFLDETRS